MPDFDPYYRWLAIPPEEQPPHHYRLLGLALFESSPEVIEAAADQRMAHLRTHQAGPHGPLSQKLLNEVSTAKLCLLKPERKAAYDAELRERLEKDDGFNVSANSGVDADVLGLNDPVPPPIIAPPPLPNAGPPRSPWTHPAALAGLAVAGAVLMFVLLVLLFGGGRGKSPRVSLAAEPAKSEMAAPAVSKTEIPPLPPPLPEEKSDAKTPDQSPLIKKTETKTAVVITEEKTVEPPPETTEDERSKKTIRVIEDPPPPPPVRPTGMGASEQRRQRRFQELHGRLIEARNQLDPLIEQLKEQESQLPPLHIKAKGFQDAILRLVARRKVLAAARDAAQATNMDSSYQVAQINSVDADILTNQFNLNVINGEVADVQRQIQQTVNAMTVHWNKADAATMEWFTLSDPLGRLGAPSQERTLEWMRPWLNERLPQPHLACGFAYAHLNRPDEALASFERMLDFDKRETIQAFALASRGFVLMKTGDDRRAGEQFAQASKVAPKSPLPRLLRGQAEFEVKRYPAAKRDLEEAMKLTKKWDLPFVEVHDGLAWLLAAAPNESLRVPKKALEYATEACQATEFSSWPELDTLAMAQAASEDFDNAVKTISRAIDIAPPEHRGALQERKQLYERQQAWHLAE